MPTLNDLKQLKADYKNTFSTEEGQRVLKNLEKLCFVHGTTFSVDDGVIQFNEGKRTVVVQIQNMIVMDLEKLREQLKENENV